MTAAHAPDFLARCRADRAARTARQADQCVLLSVVTSTEVAATLIDQAVDLHRSLRVPDPVVPHPL